MPRLGTDGVRYMVLVSGQGTSWVLSSVGPVKRSDKKKVYQVAEDRHVENAFCVVMAVLLNLKVDLI